MITAAITFVIGLVLVICRFLSRGGHGSAPADAVLGGLFIIAGIALTVAVAMHAE